MKRIVAIHARAREGSEERCPYCREAFATEDTSSPRTACTACGTPHHAACFREHGRCSMLGCGGRQTLADRRAGEDAGAIGLFDVTVAATIIFVALQSVASLVSKDNDATAALHVFALASLLVAVVAALIGGINALGRRSPRPRQEPAPARETRLPIVEHASRPLPVHDVPRPLPLPITDGRAP